MQEAAGKLPRGDRELAAVACEFGRTGTVALGARQIHAASPIFIRSRIR